MVVERPLRRVVHWLVEVWPYAAPVTIGGALLFALGSAWVRGVELPVPQAPPEGATCDEERIRLEWHAAPGEGDYEVEIDPETRGAETLERRSSQNALLLPPLAPGRYEWHVRRGSLEGPSAMFVVPDDAIAY